MGLNKTSTFPVILDKLEGSIFIFDHIPTQLCHTKILKYSPKTIVETLRFLLLLLLKTIFYLQTVCFLV